MSRSLLCGALFAAVVAGGAFAAPAMALTATTTSIYSTGMAGGGSTNEPLSQSVLGQVTNGPDGETVTVKYLKDKSGTWTVLATHTPALSSQNFSTFFKNPATKGTCKVTAKYAGDATHAASHTAKKINCATGAPL